jgi:uncharacterized membrane protein YfhO
VEIRRVRPNGFDLAVTSRTGGLVTSSVSAASGWRAQVDGRAAPVRRVNGGFLGFEAPAGTHRVRLDYRPAGWIWGLWMAGAAALVSIGLVLQATARRADRGR